MQDSVEPVPKSELKSEAEAQQSRISRRSTTISETTTTILGKRERKDGKKLKVKFIDDQASEEDDESGEDLKPSPQEIE